MTITKHNYKKHFLTIKQLHQQYGTLQKKKKKKKNKKKKARNINERHTEKFGFVSIAVLMCSLTSSSVSNIPLDNGYRFQVCSR